MRKLITSLALVLSALSSYAITPLWMRDARISPDGSEIVFCYKGDIYKVPAQGGTAVQLTTQTSLLRMESMSFSLPLYRIRQAVPCFLQER